MDGGVFAEDVVIADAQAGGASLNFGSCGASPMTRRHGIYCRHRLGDAGEVDVGAEDAAGADFHIGVNDGIGADLDAGAQPGFG